MSGVIRSKIIYEIGHVENFHFLERKSTMQKRRNRDYKTLSSNRSSCIACLE